MSGQHENQTCAPGGVDFEIIIIGAGIAGINAAYRYQSGMAKTANYAVFESRDSIGGTWDLFRYPGIRSDSDIFTFAFEWNPWPKNESLATGDDIQKYLVNSAKEAGIYDQIYFQHKVIGANWNSDDSRWEVLVTSHGAEKPAMYYSQFIYLATGYFDYETPLQAAIPGIEEFQGPVLHPQFWPKDQDWTNKDVVVIGSGATAVTIVPAMSDKAKHVTMLQRSPTYIMPLEQHSLISAVLFALLPRPLAYLIHRIGWILVTIFMIQACRFSPTIARAYIRYENKKQLPQGVSWDPHFNPRYNPWDQRLCASKDGDIFGALRAGRASVVTDTIEAVTKDSIQLSSGNVLHPDIIVTATGLQLLFAGGITITVDNKPFDYAKAFLWKGTMLQGVPNLFFTIGFENAAWTLGCDCAAAAMVRVIRQIKEQGFVAAVPRLTPGMQGMDPKPLFSLSATYLQKVNELLPKGGTGVWAPRENYITDFVKMNYGDIKTGLELL